MGQSRIHQDSMTLTDEKYYLNGNLFSGSVYVLFENQQLKNEFEVSNGKKNGKSIFYVKKENFDKNKYIDTFLVKNYQKQFEILSEQLNNLRKDSIELKTTSDDLFNNKIGGLDKFYDLEEKNNKGKLKGEKKENYDNYFVFKNKIEENKKELLSRRSELSSVNQKLNQEKGKSVFEHSKSELITFKDNNKNGLYEKHEKLKIIESGNYSNNKKNDEWKTYDSYGKLTKLETYIDNKKNGKFQEFQNEKLLTEGQHKDNLKDGEWKTYDYYGKLSVLENYKLDKREGVFKKYSGDIITEEGQYVGGLMNGEFKTYSNNGKLTSISNYLNGKLNGISQEYSSSTTDVIFEYNFQDNNLAGTQSGFYPDKSLAFKVIDDFSRLNKFKEALKLIYLGEEIKPSRIDSTAKCYLNAYEITYLNNFDLKSKLLGDKLYDIYVKEDKYSALIVQLYDIYLKNHKDPIIQKKRDDVETERQKVLNEWYAEMEALTENMREDIERFKSKNQDNSSNNSYNNSKPEKKNDESCSKCNGTGVCSECGKPQKVKYYKNGWKTDEEIRIGKTVCSSCYGDGITDEHISLNSNRIDRYEKCYVNTCNSGWIKCRRCNGKGKCDKCNGSGKKD